MILRALFLVLLVAAAPAAAQTSQPAPAPDAVDAKPVNPPPTPPADYVYTAAGRRDPFVSLIGRGTSQSRTDRSAASRPDGVKGVLVNEVVVRGIVKSTDGWVAMVGAPNGKTYTVRAGDRLMDGSVRSISPQALILMQEVNDPLSLEKQREVRKYLRGGEEVQ